MTNNVFIPPCGVYCGGCPFFTRVKKKCPGNEEGCRTRRCKGIYVCCVEKKGLEFCYQCKTFPCSRLSRFAESWLKYGQDLIANQKYISEYGKVEFIQKMKKSCS